MDRGFLGTDSMDEDEIVPDNNNTLLQLRGVHADLRPFVVGKHRVAVPTEILPKVPKQGR